MLDAFTCYTQVYSVYNPAKPDGKRYSLIRRPLTADTLQRHLEGEIRLGVFPILEDGESVRFGVIDVDCYDPTFLTQVESAAKDYPFFIQTSKSGGLHLFLLVAESVSAESMRATLTRIAAQMGISPYNSENHVEIFPKQTKILYDQGDLGNTISLPFFGAGDSWQVTPIKVLSLKSYESLMTVEDEFADAPPCVVTMLRVGIGKSERNNAMYQLAVYCRLKFHNSWEAKFRELVYQLVPGKVDKDDIESVVKSQQKDKPGFYKCNTNPQMRYCDKAACKLRRYGIGDSLLKFDTDGGLFKLDTKPPIWFLSIINRDGVPKRVSLTTPELLSFQKFQQRCVDVLNILWPKDTAKGWHQQVEAYLQKATILPPPVGMEEESILLTSIEEFVGQRTFTVDINSIGYRRLYAERGDDNSAIVYFRAVDIITHVQTAKSSIRGDNKIVFILDAMVKSGMLVKRPVQSDRGQFEVYGVSLSSNAALSQLDAAQNKER